MLTVWILSLLGVSLVSAAAATVAADFAWYSSHPLGWRSHWRFLEVTTPGRARTLAGLLDVLVILVSLSSCSPARRPNRRVSR